MKKFHIENDLPNKKITVTRFFDAPIEQVWAAWTESDVLDEWWAPKPWRAETKKMDFSEGGQWLYAMVGPDETRHWSKVDFVSIQPLKTFSAIDSFCDENGVTSSDLPGMNWRNDFISVDAGTKVISVLSFNSENDLEGIIRMGFESGFESALTNLDDYFSSQNVMSIQSKNRRASRVTSYLNFAGKTEEAFQFYKKVFNGEFTSAGLIRFGDMEMPAGMPPMSDADKNLVIHAELIIMAGHVLMATDAPESMGFKLQQGNNMHINLEPDSREETERLFKELSEGGAVTIPLQDMFWGAYFASFTDKFGINWMLNHRTSE